MENPGSHSLSVFRNRLRQWAIVVKRDIHAVYLVARDPRVPWYVKLVAFLVAGYALSPIDLIPDFIPVIGYLDDLMIVPLGILLVIHLVPTELMAEHRAAALMNKGLSKSWRAAVVIITLWVIGITLLTWLFFALYSNRSFS